MNQNDIFYAKNFVFSTKKILINDFEDFFYDHTREMKKLFDERQEGS
mgnify:CR=1 FL=1